MKRLIRILVITLFIIGSAVSANAACARWIIENETAPSGCVNGWTLSSSGDGYCIYDLTTTIC